MGFSCKLMKMINIVGLAKGTDYKSAPAGVCGELRKDVLTALQARASQAPVSKPCPR